LASKNAPSPKDTAISTAEAGPMKRGAINRKARIDDRSPIDDISQDTIEQMTRWIVLLIAVVLATAAFGMCVHADCLNRFAVW
jgi:hypothetical protein